MTNNGYSGLGDLTGGPSVLEEDMETMRGAKIRVRGLTRTQVLELRKLSDSKDFEPQMLAYGVVEPKLTKGHAVQWLDSAPAGELDSVVERIYDLSGLGEDAGKAAYKSVRGKPGA